MQWRARARHQSVTRGHGPRRTPDSDTYKDSRDKGTRSLTARLSKELHLKVARLNIPDASVLSAGSRCLQGQEYAHRAAVI